MNTKNEFLKNKVQHINIADMNVCAMVDAMRYTAFQGAQYCPCRTNLSTNAGRPGMCDYFVFGGIFSERRNEKYHRRFD